MWRKLAAPSGACRPGAGRAGEQPSRRRARHPALALLSLLALALVSCAAVPDVDDQVASAADAEAPRIVAASGPLSAEESKAILDRLAAEPGDESALQRHVALEQAVAETPLVAGNRTRILRDGPETFRAIFDAIRAARHHVNIEFYILEDVESDGVHLGDLLVEKAREGVAVNLIYDSHGSQETPAAFFDRLREAGIAVVEYTPLDPLKATNGYDPNARTHRKIVVVDGRLGITGGINLARTYESGSGSGSGASSSGGSTSGGAEAAATDADGKPTVWRDTSILIEGPVVSQLQALFVAHWHQQKGPEIDESGFFPEVPEHGDEVVRIIGSTPDAAIPRYYVAVLTAIRNAEARVWLTASYFIPTEQEMADLTAAARRGVDVRLLVPGVSDIETTVDIARSNYTELLEAGVKIWETQGVILHSKWMVVDGVWSVIGSSNFDHRSVIFNDEVDAVVLGAETGEAFEWMFEEELPNAKAIELEAWRDRPFGQRLKEHLSRLWQNWL